MAKTSLIELRGINKSYENDEVKTQVLFDLDLLVRQWEYVAIMGPSGSGKSTLLHILGILDRPTTGRYYFERKKIDSYSEEQLAAIRNKKIGFVFQAFFLLARTSVYQNVNLPLLYSDVPEQEWNERIMSAIKAVGLEHRVSHLPSQLSGGERQRVAIARALVMEPEVLFADEPTGNLDSKNGAKIMELMDDLHHKQGHTVIVITHDANVAKHAKRIIRIADGRIVSDEKT